jgi:transposase
MKRPRRNHTAAYKAKVALAARKGDKTLAELSEKFDVNTRQIVQWKTQLLEGAMGVFLSPAEKGESHGPSVRDTQAKIGQLALENDFLASARMLRDMLKREGFEVGRKRVRTLMGKMGIAAI